MSVNSHLTSVASSLVLSDAEISSIRVSIANLRKNLDSWFGVNLSGHFQFGSSTRGTILPRKADSNSDIDYMVVFGTDKQVKPQAYLDRMRTFVQNKYSTSNVKQSHPTIVLSLNHISFELAPAINNWGTYYIPSRASSWSEWQLTSPTEINQRLTDKNTNNNYQIKPLVRLIKYWNAKNGHPYPSFQLEEEILSMYFWGATSLKDYFYTFWESFTYTYMTPNYIKYKVDRAKKIAGDAKEYEQRNMPATAEAEIIKIIPSP